MLNFLTIFLIIRKKRVGGMSGANMQVTVSTVIKKNINKFKPQN